MAEANPTIALATLAGGCFWCLEAVYERLQGVHQVVSGYMGGVWENPSYADVCTGQSGHAEVVQISYDKEKLTFHQILEVFFIIHDPTTLNRQGNDSGIQYRSAIFYHDAGQQFIAKQVIAHLQAQIVKPVVTELVPVAHFYPAEPEHQHYFARHPDQAYCQHVVAPKISKFEAQFSRWVQSL